MSQCGDFFGFSLWILILLLCFLPQTWSIQSTTSDRNRPDQVDPSYWPVPSPPPSSLEGCIHQHPPIVLFTSYLFCWSDNLTPPPLGPDRRPRGSPRWTSKLCLAMPQVRGRELDCERHTGGRESSKRAWTVWTVSDVWNRMKNHKFVKGAFQ